MRVCLFIGPSLAGMDVAQLCIAIKGEVVILPPVQQGDLLRVAELEPACVAIVDGAFFQVPSVTHKEILFTLERGVPVLGAASLGALRAAELDVFGMQGVGAIYGMYRSGAIDGDDEVAVLHGTADEGYVAFTEPLVSIRHNVARARRRGIVSASTARAVVRNAKKLHFTRRTYPAVVDACRPVAPALELDELARFLRDEAEDLKQRDALALLEVLAEPEKCPRPRQISVHRTVYAHLFEREYSGRTVGGRYVSDSFVLSLIKLLSPVAVKLRRRAAFSCVAANEPPTAKARQIIGRVAARHGMSPQLLMSAPRMKPGVPWEAPLLAEARRAGEFEPMQQHAQRVLAFAEYTDTLLPGLAESLSQERLETWAAQKWGVSTCDLGRALVRRGFVSYREFFDTARLAYVYEWLTPRRSRAVAAP
jgi:hypothetical protein